MKVSNGKITAIGPGKAKVTAKVGSFTAICDVSVVKDILLGDVNLDGKISSMDARLLLSNVAGSVELTDIQKTVADINKDGKISAVDARKILNIVVNS